MAHIEPGSCSQGLATAHNQAFTRRHASLQELQELHIEIAVSKTIVQ